MDGDLVMATKTETRIPAAALTKFAANFQGEIITPVHPAYQDARKVWNGMIDRRPLLIARPSNPADVATVIRLAREHQVELAIRGGGHNVAGSGVCDGIVCDLSALRAVEVDATARTARAEGGATWLEFDRASHSIGMATTGGMVSTTGIAGLTLGGGLGWLMRAHGLACDQLVSVDLVTADGTFVTCDAATIRTCSGRCGAAAATSASPPRSPIASTRSTSSWAACSCIPWIAPATSSGTTTSTARTRPTSSRPRPHLPRARTSPPSPSRCGVGRSA